MHDMTHFYVPHDSFLSETRLTPGARSAGRRIIYTYIYIYKYIYIYIYMYIYIYVWVYMEKLSHVFMYVTWLICISEMTHARFKRWRMRYNMNIYIFIHLHINTYVYILIHGKTVTLFDVCDMTPFHVWHASRQVLAVLSAVFTAARRHPITFFLLVFNPVLLCTIASVVFPLIKAKPPVPQEMQASVLQNTSILVAIQPSAGLKGV